METFEVKMYGVTSTALENLSILTNFFILGERGTSLITVGKSKGDVVLKYH